MAASLLDTRSSTCINTPAVANLAFLATKGFGTTRDETDEIYGLVHIEDRKPKHDAAREGFGTMQQKRMKYAGQPIAGQ